MNDGSVLTDIGDKIVHVFLHAARSRSTLIAFNHKDRQFRSLCVGGLEGGWGRGRGALEMGRGWRGEGGEAVTDTMKELVSWYSEPSQPLKQWRRQVFKESIV